MSLSKADMGIARRYAALCNDAFQGQQVFEVIDAEYQRTMEQVLLIDQQTDLLAENAELKRSLHQRQPYLDPINYIQIMLLQRYRNESLSDDEKAYWLDPLLRSISAISMGMRNTG
jgi:phosphoenolpyruvate carboxylase